MINFRSILEKGHSSRDLRNEFSVSANPHSTPETDQNYVYTAFTSKIYFSQKVFILNGPILVRFQRTEISYSLNDRKFPYVLESVSNFSLGEPIFWKWMLKNIENHKKIDYRKFTSVYDQEVWKNRYLSSKEDQDQNRSSKKEYNLLTNVICMHKYINTSWV